jgi:hypothetical protein
MFCFGTFLMALTSVIAHGDADQPTGRIAAWLALLHGLLQVLVFALWLAWYLTAGGP